MLLVFWALLLGLGALLLRLRALLLRLGALLLGLAAFERYIVGSMCSLYINKVPLQW